MKEGRGSFFFFGMVQIPETEWPIRGYCQIPSLSHHITMSQEWSHCEYWSSPFFFPDLQRLLVYDLFFFFFLITWASENENVQSSIKSYFPHKHHTEIAVITGEAKIENWSEKCNQKYHICTHTLKCQTFPGDPIIEKWSTKDICHDVFKDETFAIPFRSVSAVGHPLVWSQERQNIPLY